jgi:hypothetical protein
MVEAVRELEAPVIVGIENQPFGISKIMEIWKVP